MTIEPPASAYDMTHAAESEQRATFAVVVVLPDPCNPTIMMATGAGALRSIDCASDPSVSTS